MRLLLFLLLYKCLVGTRFIASVIYQLFLYYCYIF